MRVGSRLTELHGGTRWSINESDEEHALRVFLVEHTSLGWGDDG